MLGEKSQLQLDVSIRVRFPMFPEFMGDINIRLLLQKLRFEQSGGTRCYTAGRTDRGSLSELINDLLPRAGHLMLCFLTIVHR